MRFNAKRIGIRVIAALGIIYLLFTLKSLVDDTNLFGGIFKTNANTHTHSAQDRAAREAGLIPNEEPISKVPQSPKPVADLLFKPDQKRANQPLKEIDGQATNVVDQAHVPDSKAEEKQSAQAPADSSDVPGVILKPNDLYTDQLFRTLGPYSFDDPAKLSARLPILPREGAFTDDRIVHQMRFVPEGLAALRKLGIKRPNKRIVFMSGGGVEGGQKRLIDDNCPVKECEYELGSGGAATADLLMWQHSAWPPSHKRPPGQLWVMYMLESPYHTGGLGMFNGQFNFTATYRHDSSIVAPYYKWYPYNSMVLTRPQTKDYSKGKTKKVAWFVSNCGARNNRLQYAQELSKYIEVDIYGACGSKQCPRSQSNTCFDYLNNDYKFYLAFENSNCRDYITEKFFLNGLEHDVIPIVMGAHPDDYKRAAPPHSFLHVDDFEGPQQLAEYLHKLDKDPVLYNEYFAWKGTGNMINCFFWCRLCMMAHLYDHTLPDVVREHLRVQAALLPDGSAPEPWVPSEMGGRASRIEDVERWWRGPGICISGSWRSETNKQFATD